MWLIDLIRGRCPHCRQRNIFAGLWRMNETCPHCAIRFEREQGYFTMAIFIAYLIGFVLVALSLVILWAFGAPITAYYVVPTAVLILAVPLMFRYGRVIWLYIDEWLDPHDTIPKI